MFNITKEGIISLARGDSASIPLFINYGTDLFPVQYRLQKNNILYLGICLPGQLFEDAILKKTYNPDNWQLDCFGNLIISLFPEDTENLTPGLYYYTVKLLTTNKFDNSENIQTLIKKTKFFIED